MKRSELIDAIAKDTGLSKKDTDAVLKSLVGNVESELKKGGTVEFVGFGKFQVKERAARNGRNPQTGETIKIAAAKVPSFKVGQGLKDAVQ